MDVTTSSLPELPQTPANHTKNDNHDRRQHGKPTIQYICISCICSARCSQVLKHGTALRTLLLTLLGTQSSV